MSDEPKVIANAMRPHVENEPCWCNPDVLYLCESCEGMGCWQCDNGTATCTDYPDCTHDIHIFVHNDV